MIRTLTTTFLLGLATATAQAQFFSEDFDDGNGASRWSAPVVDSEAGVFDGTVDFGFDYGALGIPAAPGGGGTVGLFMEANRDRQRERSG